MIHESGRVVDNDGITTWIEVEHDSSCGGCAVNKECGVAILGQGLGKRKNIFSTSKLSKSYSNNSKVTILIAEKKLVLLSFYAYIVPLFFMIMLSVVSEQILHLSELFTVIFALLGFALGCLIMFFYNKKHGDIHNSVLIR